MKIVCVSDTHSTQRLHPKLGGLSGDMLIHAGDLTPMGTYAQLKAATDWLRSLDFEHKVVIAGNHDLGLEPTPEWAAELFDGLIYLNRSSRVVAGLKVYGTPWSPEFCGWAFNASPEQARENAAAIPDGIDVLVTHGPPRGAGDLVEEGQHVGCPHLTGRINVIKPRLVVCGHIHEAYGTYKTAAGVTVVNASALDRRYQPTNAPIEVTL